MLLLVWLVWLGKGGSAPDESDDGGNGGRDDAEFLGEIGSMEQFLGTDGAFANEGSGDCHDGGGAKGIGQEKSEVATPRRDGQGRRQRRGTIPTKSMQEPIEDNGTILFANDGVLRCSRGRERHGSFVVIPFPCFLESHQSNNDQGQSNSHFRYR